MLVMLMLMGALFIGCGIWGMVVYNAETEDLRGRIYTYQSREATWLPYENRFYVLEKTEVVGSYPLPLAETPVGTLVFGGQLDVIARTKDAEGNIWLAFSCRGDTMWVKKVYTFHINPYTNGWTFDACTGATATPIPLFDATFPPTRTPLPEPTTLGN
jgi:hypothetical protein